MIWIVHDLASSRCQAIDFISIRPIKTNYMEYSIQYTTAPYEEKAFENVMY